MDRAFLGDPSFNRKNIRNKTSKSIDSLEDGKAVTYAMCLKCGAPAINSHIISQNQQKKIGKYPTVSNAMGDAHGHRISVVNNCSQFLFCAKCDTELFLPIEGNSQLNLPSPENPLAHRVEISKKIGLMAARTICGAVAYAISAQTFFKPHLFQGTAHRNGHQSFKALRDELDDKIHKSFISHYPEAIESGWPSSMFMLHTAESYNRLLPHLIGISRNSDFLVSYRSYFEILYDAFGGPELSAYKKKEILRPANQLNSSAKLSNSNLNEHLHDEWACIAYTFDSPPPFATSSLFIQIDDGHDDDSHIIDDIIPKSIEEICPFFLLSHTNAGSQPSAPNKSYFLLTFPLTPLSLQHGNIPPTSQKKMRRDFFQHAKENPGVLMQNLWGLMPFLICADNFTYADCVKDVVHRAKKKLFNDPSPQNWFALHSFFSGAKDPRLTCETDLQALQQQIFCPSSASAFTMAVPRQGMFPP